MLIGLSENSFASVPAPVHQEVMAFARAMKSSKPADDSFNFLRDQEAGHKAHKLGRASRWHKTVHSGVMQDAGRKAVQVTDAGRFAAGKTLPATMFMAKSVSDTLDEELLQRFRQSKKPWGPKPDAFHLTADRLEALLQAKGDYSKLKRSWLALLAEEGSIVYRPGTNLVEHGLVLSTSEFGAVVWKVHGKRRGEFKFYVLKPAPGVHPWKQLQLWDDLADWRVTEVDALAPAVASAKCNHDVEQRPGLLLVPRATKPLLAAAAAKAFYKLNFGRLRELATTVLELEIPKPKPRSEYDWCRVLMKHVLLSQPDGSIDSLMEEWRGCKPKPSTWGMCLTEKGVEALDGVLDADEVEQVKEAVADHTAKSKGLQKACAQPSSSSSAPAGRGKRAPRLMKVGLGKVFGRADARALLPMQGGIPVKGCSVQIDKKLHMRWIASYPNPFPPYSHSCVWNDTVSERTACLRVIRWAWQCHTAATGEACVWEFGHLGDG